MLPDSSFLRAALGEPLGVDLRLNIASGSASADTLNTRERRRWESLESSVRAKSWLLGRKALKLLRSEVDGRGDIDDLEFPNARYSLSHSADVALAVADVSGDLAGIGVDLEVDTVIKPAAARFFLTEHEQHWLDRQAPRHLPHLLLRLWCIKEAVFKANPGNSGKTLGDHELVEPGNPSGDAHASCGRIIRYASWCEARTCVALAVSR